MWLIQWENDRQYSDYARIALAVALTEATAREYMDRLTAAFNRWFKKYAKDSESGLPEFSEFKALLPPHMSDSEEWEWDYNGTFDVDPVPVVRDGRLIFDRPEEIDNER